MEKVKWKIGNIRQLVIAVVLTAIAAVGTEVDQVSNIHFVVTIILFIMNLYACNAWNKGGRLENNVPPSKAFLIAFVINALISFAWSWWISGIMWVLITCIYIAIQTPKEKEEKKEIKS